MPYLFTPPAVRRPVSLSDRLWSRFHYQVGQALIKKDGFYTLGEVVTDEQVADADAAYLGGHTYLVADDEASALTAAGYGAYLSIPPSTSGYGRGRFGVGAYGEGDPDQALALPGGAYGEGAYGDGIYRG